MTILTSVSLYVWRLTKLWSSPSTYKASHLTHETVAGHLIDNDCEKENKVLIASLKMTKVRAQGCPLEATHEQGWGHEAPRNGKIWHRTGISMPAGEFPHRYMRSAPKRIMWGRPGLLEQNVLPGYWITFGTKEFSLSALCSPSENSAQAMS